MSEITDLDVIRAHKRDAHQEINAALDQWHDAREKLIRAVHAYAKASVEEEREACALLAYSFAEPLPGASWRESIGYAIRRRGDTDG